MLRSTTGTSGRSSTLMGPRSEPKSWIPARRCRLSRTTTGSNTPPPSCWSCSSQSATNRLGRAVDLLSRAGIPPSPPPHKRTPTDRTPTAAHRLGKSRFRNRRTTAASIHSAPASTTTTGGDQLQPARQLGSQQAQPKPPAPAPSAQTSAHRRRFSHRKAGRRRSHGVSNSSSNPGQLTWCPPG